MSQDIKPLEFGEEELYDNNEFRKNQILRASFPEFLNQIPIIRLNRKVKDIADVVEVDGYYRIEEDGLNVARRQIREYRAKSFEDAVQQAKNEGLLKGIMVEQPLTPEQLCVLRLIGFNEEERNKVIREHNEYLDKFYSKLI
ncbi:hypothetical protein HYW74_04695 [Candidatus Pacearchaeota archaeon]|nr:hypothetical protein [Candidatus Pacearchaeota archaeon]